MKKIYSLTWSKIKERWILVDEKVASKGGPSGIVGAITLAAFLSLSGTALSLDPGALPTGGKITAGSGSIATLGRQMTVNQSTQKMVASWDTFNIGKRAGVTFRQPGSDAVALNRIYDQNPSQILGSLSANGKIYLINPSGIVFGEGAQVNVGGLVASSLNMLDSDFLAGKYTFTNNGKAGSVINQGNITAADGGIVALLAPKVTNEGTIAANSGSVILGAGNQVTLDFTGDGLISYTIDQGAVDAMAQNKGLIKADGGIVVMTAKAADNLTNAVVNNTGIIEAQTLQGKGGKILLMSDMASGTTIVGGTLDASAPNGGDGGFIETSAKNVKVNDGAIITTAAPKGSYGTWLIDPVDYNIAATGGDITGATLSANLGAGNVIILSSQGSTGTGGDVNVNDAVYWEANTILTLSAYRNVNVNADVEARGTMAGLVLTSDTCDDACVGSFNLNNGAKITLSGHDVTLYIDGHEYVVANSANGIYNAGVLDGYFALGTDLEAAGFTGFVPIGDETTPFTGHIEGLNHTVTNLDIPFATENPVGLFGYIGSGGTIRNYHLVDLQVDGNEYVGGIAGYNAGTITNCSVTGDATGYDYVGGIAGYNTGTISNSYATSTVSGIHYVGGLVGKNDGGSISNSYATGDVDDDLFVGTDVGGLVGNNAGTVSYSYSAGLVSGAATNKGGLIGINSGSGSVTNSFWDTTTSGTSDGIGGGADTGATGLTTANMMKKNSFSGWDIASSGGSSAVWRIYEDNSYPLLRSVLIPSNVTANDDTRTYGDPAYSGGNGVTYSVDEDWQYSGEVAYSGTSQGASTPGIYTIVPSGLYSDQKGYDITFVNGTLTVNKAPLSVTAYGDSKTYDGLAYSGNNGVVEPYSGFVNGETSAVLGGTLTYGGNAQGAINAGFYNITPGGLTSDNYAISFVSGTLTVSKVPLSITANDYEKIYDGIAYNGEGVVYSGFITGESPAVLGGSLTNSALGIKDEGTYDIDLGGQTSNNYNITFVDGTLTINPRPANWINGGLTNIVTKTYDGTTVATLVPGNYELTNFVPGEGANVTETVGTYDSASVGTGKTVTVSLSLGDYEEWEGTDLGNYTLPTSVTGNVGTITQKDLTVTANNDSKTYNGQAYSGGKGVVYSGFVNGEASGVLGGSLTYSGTSQGATNAGGYVIAPSGLLSSNYHIIFEDGTLTINPLLLRTVISGSLTGSVTKAYNGTTVATLIPTNYLLTGWLDDDGATVTETVGTYDSANAGTGKTVTVNLTIDDYTEIGDTDFNNYILPTTVTGNVGEITPVALSVTANPDTKPYDGVAYSGGNGVSYIGFVNGEGPGVLGGFVSYGGTSQGAIDPGSSYTIMPFGLLSDNYDISYNAGFLMIEEE